MFRVTGLLLRTRLADVEIRNMPVFHQIAQRDRSGETLKLRQALYREQVRRLQRLIFALKLRCVGGFFGFVGHREAAAPAEVQEVPGFAVLGAAIRQQFALHDGPPRHFVDGQAIGYQGCLGPRPILDLDLDGPFRIPAAHFPEPAAAAQLGQRGFHVGVHGVAQEAEDGEERGFARAVGTDENRQPRHVAQFHVLECAEVCDPNLLDLHGARWPRVPKCLRERTRL